jgi:chemosensory pili system protein ChpA (sensor histidine kinase/response regulator)
MKVLLIEPDIVLARLYASILSDKGFQVTVVNEAQLAITTIDEQCPDVILLELQLPHHNGVEFLYELRSYPEWKTIPVIVLADMTPDKTVSANAWRHLGVSAYYYKPASTLSALVTLVQGMTELRVA